MASHQDFFATGRATPATRVGSLFNDRRVVGGFEAMERYQKAWSIREATGAQTLDASAPR